MSLVSNTSPLYYLRLIGHEEVLLSLYGPLIIPTKVHTELLHPASLIHLWVQSLPNWISVIPPRTINTSLNIDAGEREAIALALEVGASHLLIDDKKGRKAAQSLGLRVRGTLAVLVEASTAGLLDLNDALDRLEKTNFLASRSLINETRTRYSKK